MVDLKNVVYKILTILSRPQCIDSALYLNKCLVCVMQPIETVQVFRDAINHTWFWQKWNWFTVTHFLYYVFQKIAP